MEEGKVPAQELDGLCNYKFTQLIKLLLLLQNGQKLVGPYGSESRMLPSDQGFRPDDGSLLDRELGLIEQPHLIGIECGRERLPDCRIALVLLSHITCVEYIPIILQFLHHLASQICIHQKVEDIRGSGGVVGNPAIQADIEPIVGFLERFHQALDLLGQGLVKPAVLEEHEIGIKRESIHADGGTHKICERLCKVLRELDPFSLIELHPQFLAVLHLETETTHGGFVTQ